MEPLREAPRESPRFAALGRVAEELARAGAGRDLPAAVEASARGLLDAGWAALYRAEPDGSFSLTSPLLAPPELPQTVSGGEAALLLSFPAAPILGAPVASGIASFSGAALAAPIDDASRRLGWIVLGPRADGAPFAAEDAQLLSLLGCLAAPRLVYADLIAEHTHASLTDELTGLGNRRAFDQRLEEEIARSNRSSQPVSLLLCELDNPAAGPSADRLVRDLADLVRASIRGSDIAFRIGDAKLAILLTNSDSAGARIAADRIRRRVASLDDPATPAVVTASVGAAVLKRGFHTPVSLAAIALIKKADEALYQARRSGGNRSIVG